MHPDAHNRVRTVTVGMPRKDKNAGILPYVPKPLEEYTLGIQRIVVLCPVEEQNLDDVNTMVTEQNTEGDTIGQSVVDGVMKKKTAESAVMMHKFDVEVTQMTFDGEDAEQMIVQEDTEMTRRLTATEQNMDEGVLGDIVGNNAAVRGSSSTVRSLGVSGGCDEE